MPKASVSLETEHFDLKSCEGGWVELRRMTYGQKLERQQLATDMEVEMVQGSKTQKATIDIAQKAIALFEFRHCIIDHNLFEGDDESTKFDFKNPKTLDKLDPRIGEEIGTYIDKLNNFEAQVDDLGN